MASCSEFLEAEFENSVISEDFLLTQPGSVEGLLMNAYIALPSYQYENEIATDNATSNLFSNDYFKMGKGEWSSEFNPVKGWTNDYGALKYIHHFESLYRNIKWDWRFPERNPHFVKRFTGEIFGLRAYFLLDLLKKHGGETSDGKILGIPIVLSDMTQNENLKLPRNTFDECITQIINDCDSAIKYLPLRYVNGSALDPIIGRTFDGRMDGHIAMVIKSRATLLAASPAFTVGKTETEIATLWENAAKAAAQYLKIIGGTAGFSTRDVAFYAANFQDDPEIIWRKRVVTSGNGGTQVEKDLFPPSLYGNAMVNPSQNLIDAFPMATGYLAVNDAERKDYTKKDKRFQAFIIYQGAKLKNATINTYIGAPNDGIALLPASTRTGYYLKKFVNENVSLIPTNVTGAPHFVTLARRTEIFLNYAEAMNEAFGPNADPLGIGLTAKDVMALIRKRAGIDSNPALAGYQDQYLDDQANAGKDAFRNLIKNERRVELCFEGDRFWDLRRWKDNITEPVNGVYITNNSGVMTYNYTKIEDRNYQPHMYYGPIPYTETLKYNIPQNKGW